MSEPFLGQIQAFGFNFAPRGWATCDGQILPIAQNTALFSLLGTTYGGNGQTTFALPDLRGRVAVHQGQGPGLSPYVMGEVTGSESVTLTITSMPAHVHSVTVAVGALSASQSPTADPAGNSLIGGSTNNIYGAGDPDVVMNAKMAKVTEQIAGGSQPHNNLQPLLCINFCISLQGIFPSRN
jgi:microcystin-dependent protein